MAQGPAIADLEFQANNLGSPWKVGRGHHGGGLFWEDRPGSVIRRQETRERKNTTGTLRVRKDYLILPNVR